MIEHENSVLEQSSDTPSVMQHRITVSLKGPVLILLSQKSIDVTERFRLELVNEAEVSFGCRSNELFPKANVDWVD